MTDRLLLCTDLDRTLIPNGAAPESPQARAYFRQFVAQPQVTLAYVTGRHLALIDQAILDYQLPHPQFAIADVGSSIYTWQNSQWHRWQTWDDHLATDWPKQGAIAIYHRLVNHPALQLQESAKQSHYKLSYYVDLQADTQQLLIEIKTLLEKHDFSTHLIWSVDEEKQIGLLDILPSQANKYQAISFLMATQKFSLAQTIFAGDSGNDEAVLSSPIPAVLVANAHQELRKKLQDAHDQASLYFAQGNCLGMNGNYSAGILEGIFYYFPEYQQWLNST